MSGLDPTPESADEWARLDGANADEDARGRVTQVLREFGHEENDSNNGWVLFADALGDIADALIAAGLIKGTSDNGPMLSGEELRTASEKVDEWVREDDQAAPVASREVLIRAIWDADSTFSDTIADHLLAAGVFRDEATVKAEALREAAATARLAAANSFTNNGRYENESIADWLDDQADAIDPTRTEGAHP